MKLSEEAYNKIMELLEAERDLQQGHEDRIEKINTIIDEVVEVGTY